MSEARTRLLEAVVTELDERGLGDRSLRDIADAAGTSHRMLIHHFGSREGLLVAVVEAVEEGERQRALALGPLERGGEQVRSAYRETWRHFAARAQAGRERLFFECYARGLQGEEPFVRLSAAAVTTWLPMLTKLQEASGAPAGVAKARARLDLALIRGLLLDLLATGDRRGTAAAIDEYARLVQAG
ncbi:MAG: transcriptional regulator, TetR family protein [Actinomycetia bacterium]|nr:transcriptional regulator, TetR family protein [Actinomycetes bacterium]